MKKRDFKAMAIISILVFIFLLYNGLCGYILFNNYKTMPIDHFIELFVFGNVIIILFSVMFINIYYLFKDYKDIKTHTEEDEKKLEELKCKYSNYTTLVEEETSKELYRLKKENIIQIPKDLSAITTTTHEYLLYFEDLLDSAYEETEVDKLDSFVIAAC